MNPLPEPEALAALNAAGVAAPLAERLAMYAALVLEANRRINLTGAKSGAAFAEHLLDALTLAEDVQSPLIDVGSGNGVPGIPLALATGARVVLLEPIRKRAAFLESAIAALGIDGSVVARRAEEAGHDPQYREQFRTATARGVGPATTVAELTVPFLAEGGRALLQRGGVDEAEREALSDAALVLGAHVAGTLARAGERQVVVLQKQAPTNPRFPRRNGIPAKRPLCAS